MEVFLNIIAVDDIDNTEDFHYQLFVAAKGIIE